MHIKLTVLCLLNFSVAFSPVDVVDPSKVYYPEEENMFRIKRLIVDDDNGKHHDEDLTIPPDPSYKVSLSEIKFYLYTKFNYVPDIILASSFEALKTSHFKSARKNAFIIHGWTCDYRSSVNIHIKRAILKTEDANIFVIDWSGPASGSYVRAKAAVPEVGRIVGDFINKIIATYDVSTSQFYLIGHSLGAHIAGCAGAAISGPNKVHSIVGLDPAGPLFTYSNTDNRIDPSDGDFVHIIHTNSRRLGFGSAIGDVDYYPDGGAVQNDCGQDLSGRCSHSKAYEYYALSISGTLYNSTRCGSYKKYLNGKCVGNPTSLMGMFDVNRSAFGPYYFTINGSSPITTSIALVFFYIIVGIINLN